MTKNIILDGNIRSELGSSSSERIRKEGKIPCVIYNDSKENIYLTVSLKDFTIEYVKGRIKVRPIEIKVGNQKYKTLAYKIDKHPVSEKIIHIDFKQITEDKEMKVEVPVEFVDKDKSLGLKRGAFLNIVRRTLKVYCLPKNIPDCIKVSVDGMFSDEFVKLSSIKLPEGVRFANNKTIIVCNLIGTASTRRNYVVEVVKEDTKSKKKKK